MFCPKCGNLLMPKIVKNKKVLGCSCGYSDKKSTDATIKEEIKSKDSNKIEILENNEDNTLPETEAECPKCGNKKAKYWLVQTRAADEPETKFLKCTKCFNIWRDYS